MMQTAGKLWGLRRMADNNGVFKMTAVDQGPPVKDPITAYLGIKQAPWDQIARFKGLLIEILQDESTAMLLDPHYAIPYAIDTFDPAKGLIVTLEDSLFKETGNGRLSENIDDWSVAKIKRMGGDAVKVLVWYHPDTSEAIKIAQQNYVKRIGEDCARYDIPFLLELLVYPLATDKDKRSKYIEIKGKRVDDVLGSVEEFAKPEYGVDIFKLESPVNAQDADGSAKVQALFDEMGRLAKRPWVMLSGGTGKVEFCKILKHAFAAGASGFLAGRAIWLDAFNAYPDWCKIRKELEGSTVHYLKEISSLADEKATSWTEHSCFGVQGACFSPADESFRHHYADFGDRE